MSNTAVALVELRGQLEARAEEFAKALPKHIDADHFIRAAETSIQLNPKLLDVDRRSLINELLRCANDGLIPDGRQAVLVIFKDRDRGLIAKYMQMIAGIRVLVQQSGEITRFEQTIVYQNDKFDYQAGDRPHIRHAPALENRGEPTLVYSIAQFRDGTLSREVMSVADIEKARGISRSKDSGPWVDWWTEMARKTVAKRHAKVLPMSNDTKGKLARDDEEFTMPFLPPEPTQPAKSRPRLMQQLDQISTPLTASNDKTTQRPRGRPRSPKTADDGKTTEAADPAENTTTPPDDLLLDDDLQMDLSDKADSAEDDWPGPSPDFERGRKDRIAGRASCLDRAIRENAARFKEWQRGFDSVREEATT